MQADLFAATFGGGHHDGRFFDGGSAEPDQVRAQWISGKVSASWDVGAVAGRVLSDAMTDRLVLGARFEPPFWIRRFGGDPV